MTVEVDSFDVHDSQTSHRTSAHMLCPSPWEGRDRSSGGGIEDAPKLVTLSRSRQRAATLVCH